MKRVLLMVSLSLFPRLLVAQELDLKSLAGEHWYGLYMNGQKAGFAIEAVEVNEDGSVVVREDAQFRVSMMGVQQNMKFNVKRTYAKDGSLSAIDQDVDDGMAPKKFTARIEGDKLKLTTVIGSTPREKEYPKPKESLSDALKQVKMIGPDAKVGDQVDFSIFEPMYERELDGVAKIEAIEQQMFEGAPTKVFRIRSTMPSLGIDSEAVVAGDGTTLEDTIGGLVKMRLEPKEVAQDVQYNNDVIVSNAAVLDKPINAARTRESIDLKITGPITADHLFNNDRQQFTAVDGGYKFVGKKASVAGLAPVKVPVQEAAVAEWLKPSTFVQSDDPRLIAKAHEVAGDETDAFAISSKLCEWVHSYVETTFSAQLTNALEVLENPRGDCTEHSILFIGLARAAGIPAREVAGLIYVETPKPGFYFHQWATVWVGKWVDVDPTFNQPLADATHIKLGEGDLFEQAKLVPVIGRLRIEVLEDAQAVAAEKEKP